MSATLDSIYHRMDGLLTCKGLCADACGPIGLTKLERSRIKRCGGHILDYDERKGGCSALKDGRCAVYELRPAICRLYGLVRRMRCQHGCVPARWLSDAEAHEILEDVSAIGGEEILLNGKAGIR